MEFSLRHLHRALTLGRFTGITPFRAEPSSDNGRGDPRYIHPRFSLFTLVALVVFLFELNTIFCFLVYGRDDFDECLRALLQVVDNYPELPRHHNRSIIDPKNAAPFGSEHVTDSYGFTVSGNGPSRRPNLHNTGTGTDDAEPDPSSHRSAVVERIVFTVMAGYQPVAAMAIYLCHLARVGRVAEMGNTLTELSREVQDRLRRLLEDGGSGILEARPRLSEDLPPKTSSDDVQNRRGLLRGSFVASVEKIKSIWSPFSWMFCMLAFQILCSVIGVFWGEITESYVCNMRTLSIAEFSLMVGFFGYTASNYIFCSACLVLQNQSRLNIEAMGIVLRRLKSHSKATTIGRASGCWVHVSPTFLGVTSGRELKTLSGLVSSENHGRLEDRAAPTAHSLGGVHPACLSSSHYTSAGLGLGVGDDGAREDPFPDGAVWTGMEEAEALAVLENCRRAQVRISMATDQLSSAFSPTLLARFFSSTFLCVVLLYGVCIGLARDVVWLPFVDGALLLYPIWDVLTLSLYGEKVKEQVRVSWRSVACLIESKLPSAVRRELLVISFQMTKNLADPNASDFFPVNRSAVLTVTGTVAMYLVVILQANIQEFFGPQSPTQDK